MKKAKDIVFGGGLSMKILLLASAKLTCLRDDMAYLPASDILRGCKQADLAKNQLSRNLTLHTESR